MGVAGAQFASATFSPHILFMPRDSATSISIDELIKAYTLGYFPMARARDEDTVVWVLPDERGVISLAEARSPRRLRRFLKSEPFELRLNTAFTDVMTACADATPARPDHMDQ